MYFKFRNFRGITIKVMFGMLKLCDWSIIIWQSDLAISQGFYCQNAKFRKNITLTNISEFIVSIGLGIMQ